MILDDLLALGSSLPEADVNPIGCACRSGFLLPDELVEVEVALHPEEPTLAGGFIGNADVGSFACHVLARCHTTDRSVKAWRTIAGTDRNRAVEVFAEGFENVDAELLEIADHFECRLW